MKMNDREKILDVFSQRMLHVERELEGLEKLSQDIVAAYDGNAFPGQGKLVTDTLENLMTAATHEIASQIGFYRNDIEHIARLIAFREKYREFTDDELTEILDGSPSPAFKKNLLGHLTTVAHRLTLLDELKKDWNQSFRNKSYGQVKKQLRIEGSQD